MNKYKLLVVLLLSLIAICFIFFLLKAKLTNTNGAKVIMSNNSITFGSQMLNDKKEKMRETFISQEGNFEGNLLLYGKYIRNESFDIILLDNFKKVDFSLNGSEEANLNRVDFSKSQNNSMDYYNYTIKFNCLDPGLNDMLFIFKRKTIEQSSENYNKNPSKSLYTLRFSVMKSGISYTNSDINFDTKYKILKGNPLDDIFVYEKEFDEFIDATNKTPSSYTTVNIIDGNIGLGKKIKLPLSINTTTPVLRTRFTDQFYLAKKSSAKEQIAIFALMDNNIIPLDYNSNQESLLKFYEKEVGETIMINPEYKVLKKELNILDFITVIYPYTRQEQLANTYKIAQWNNCILSDDIIIKAK